jgi:MoaA/NifB/PqqE/SkfB family radical SAM enzyme
VNAAPPTDRAARSTFGFTAWDVADRPEVVIWEATRACSLACRHCRARAQRRPGPDELTTREAEALLRQVARLRPRVFVVTGGDPLERPDFWPLWETARSLGLTPALAPSVTPRLDAEAIARLAELGCAGIQISLDGASPATHDRFRGQVGSFARTLAACRAVREAGIPLTIGTTVARHDVEELAAIYELVAELGASRWSLFFLVPTGRARAEEMISAEYAEAVFLWLLTVSREAPFAIKTTEAPAIRRLALRQGWRPAGPQVVADGRGFLFVAAHGAICPSGFLPLPAGDVRHDDLLTVYREHPLFQALRDPDRLRGPRCGRCPYRAVCGGSRSRAYAVTGDPLGDDPLCGYAPGEGGGPGW